MRYIPIDKMQQNWHAALPGGDVLAGILHHWLEDSLPVGTCAARNVLAENIRENQRKNEGRNRLALKKMMTCGRKPSPRMRQDPSQSKLRQYIERPSLRYRRLEVLRQIARQNQRRH